MHTVDRAQPSPYILAMPADAATDNWVWHVRSDKVGSMAAALHVDGRAYSIFGPIATRCPPALTMPSATARAAAALASANRTFASPKRLVSARTSAKPCEASHGLGSAFYTGRV